MGGILQCEETQTLRHNVVNVTRVWSWVRTHVRAQILGTIDPVLWLRVGIERRTGAGHGGAAGIEMRWKQG